MAERACAGILGAANVWYLELSTDCTGVFTLCESLNYKLQIIYVSIYTSIQFSGTPHFHCALVYCVSQILLFF